MNIFLLVPSMFYEIMQMFYILFGFGLGLLFFLIIFLVVISFCFRWIIKKIAKSLSARQVNLIASFITALIFFLYAVILNPAFENLKSFLLLLYSLGPFAIIFVFLEIDDKIGLLRKITSKKRNFLLGFAFLFSAYKWYRLIIPIQGSHVGYYFLEFEISRLIYSTILLLCNILLFVVALLMMKQNKLVSGKKGLLLVALVIIILLQAHAISLIY